MKQDIRLPAVSQTCGVGILASAGGLEAATLLVADLPAGPSAFYVLAQHMSPTHKSMLSVLLTRQTELPVLELRGDVVPAPGTIYVPPPNADVVYEDGMIRLMEPNRKIGAPKPSGDRLLTSLAAAMGDRSVAIVLSGTGSDGSYGVKAVREAGGITIAQEPSTAKYSGMPEAAIQSGCVDLVLSPTEIGQNFARILAHPRDLEGLIKSQYDPTALGDLFQILAARTRIDFREYKASTVNRRVARRMVANGIDDYEAYLDLCRASATEVDALGQDLLISVTRFFRDRKQFDDLREAIDDLVARASDDQLRIWVAGCATGEEAYSIAILVSEAVGGPKHPTKRRVQIFATDIDDRALEAGRRGVYPITAAEDIPEAYLERYFTTEEGRLEVRRELRQLVMFSRHNLITDPPFLNLDLVSLRNVLIYFNPVLQERVFSRIDYALDTDGVLFLGTSETPMSTSQSFDPRPGSDRVFVKRRPSPRRSTPFALRLDALEASRPPPAEKPARRPVVPTPREDHRFEALARAVAPNGFLVTPGHEIVRVFGEISDVIELNETVPLGFSTKLLKGPMRNEAASLTTTALRTRHARTGHWHRLDSAEDQEVRLRCYPILGKEGDHTALFAVETRESARPTPATSLLSDVEREEYVEAMEAQMAGMRDALNRTIEELQHANGELQSVNEEYQSANEELQAANEEFETANEELQSTNEELVTVNDEMHANTGELKRVTTELGAILTHSPYPVLIVDQDMLIRRSSRRAREFFALRDMPAGGIHVSQCALPPGFPSFTEACAAAMQTGERRSTSVEVGSKQYTTNMTPFLDGDGAVLGVKVSVMEFDAAGFETMAALMDEMGGLAHWRLNIAANTLYWSKAVFRIHGLDEDGTPPTVGEAIHRYAPEDRARIADHVDQAIREKRSFAFDARLIRADGSTVPVRAACSVVTDGAGTATHLVGAFRDLSRQERDGSLVRQLSEMCDRALAGFFSLDVVEGELTVSEGARRVTGLDRPVSRRGVDPILTCWRAPDRERLGPLLGAARETGRGFDFEGVLADGPEAGRRCRLACRVGRSQWEEVAHLYGSLTFVDEA
jgi:chemotaxis protein methyltransferase CheR/two-component system CheB/CheR fusion protein